MCGMGHRDFVEPCCELLQRLAHLGSAHCLAVARDYLVVMKASPTIKLLSASRQKETCPGEWRSVEIWQLARMRINRNVPLARKGL